MAIILFCVGALTFIAGGVMIAFGIPINEFSFGNTLIMAGVTAAVGGLIVCGLGAVVSKLRQIADSLGAPAPMRVARPADLYEAAGGMPAAAVPPGQIPFPQRPPARAPQPFEPRPPAPPPGPSFEPPATQSFAPTFAPTLRNPDEPPVAVEEEETLLSPPLPPEAEEPMAAPAEPEAPRRLGLGLPPSPLQERQPSSDFDRMWPPELRPYKAPLAGQAEPEPQPPPYGEAAAPEPLEGAEAPTLAAQAPPVAVLKSGVVDGMAYTLYVDGSIEAEMPQGTLRFASINELRDYLESNS